MGQYLCVGLCTGIRASREEAEKQYGSIDEFAKSVAKNLNLNIDLYEVNKDEEDVYLALNPQILERDLPALLKRFYAICYADADTKKPDCDRIVEALKECKNADDIYNMSKKKCCFCFREGFHYDYISAQFYGDHLLISVKSIILCIAGKIIIESAGELFNFFARLLHKEFGDIQLSGALSVYIDG